MSATSPGIARQRKAAAKQPHLHIAIACVPDPQTTAIYFERAARTADHDVTLVHETDTASAGQHCDLFIAIDPWFGGLRYLPDLDCPTAVIQIDVHRGMQGRAKFARFFDHVFVAQRDFVPKIAAIGHDSVHWMPLGGDPGVHYVPDLPRDIEVGFVGKLGMPGTDRHTVLSQVLRHFSTNEIGRHQTPWEMGKIYSRSRIVFNKSIGGDVNMRFFEAMASGALLVTDRIGNGLHELAEEGVHYVGYDTAEEAVAQIKHYLAHEADRERIAQAGQALLYERHTYDARLQQLLRTVATGSRTAPARQAAPRQRRLWRAEWARLHGISMAAAAGLVAEGLAPGGYGDLTIGLARGAKRKMDGLRRTW
jgi:hypothetical protein